MTEPTEGSVTEAIQDLKWLYRVGQDSLRRRREPGAHGERAIDREAAERGLNPDALRRVRIFASEAGYTREELAELCRLCREHRYPLGRRILYRLLAIPRRQRDKVQREAIVEHWTAARMDSEIRQRFGRRKLGGKAPDMPETVADTLDQIEHLARRWLRWTELLGRPPQEHPNGGGVWAQLPANVQQRLASVDKAMCELRAAVVAEQ